MGSRPAVPVDQIGAALVFIASDIESYRTATTLFLDGGSCQGSVGLEILAGFRQVLGPCG
ncbi:MAG: hypothetical protein V9G08_06555 [Dermatophilaceae bacterium]